MQPAPELFQFINRLFQFGRFGSGLLQRVFERGQFVQRLLLGLSGQFADAFGHAVAPVGGETRKIFLGFPTRFPQQ